MKTRLFCLALCLLMLVSTVLTGCSGKTNEEAESEITETASASARTLTMWLVSEKEIDAETASRITNAVNVITESKFKTRLKLYFFTDAEYQAVVSETIRAREDSKSIFTATDSSAEKETTAADESATIVEETVTDQYGRVTIKYPDLTPNQVDLIYIQGEEMFREYVASGWLKQLDEELSASSKKIKEYVSQTLLSAAKISGGTYAIPNNNTIGEYTYMLINKDLAEKFGTDGVYQKGKIDGFFNTYIYSYLENVKALNDTSIVPIDASYDEVLALLAHYWSIDPDTYATDSERFSLLGYRYTDPATLSKGNTILSFDSLLGDETFRKHYYELNAMRISGGYYNDDALADTETAAIKFESGSLADYNLYCNETSKYYPVIVKYPSVDTEDVYSNMFGVCTYTEDLSRSMQILTYLTTNADFRNLIQYGVEGEDYEVEKDENGNDVVVRLQEAYMMDIFKTGNAFIAYPDPAKNLSADVWEIGKEQNRDALIEPLLNFDFAQLVKDSAAGTSSTPKVGANGYTYTWTTGYSREVLAQNELLKAWMKAADENGKGVYVLHTCSSNSGQNLSAMVYYYNNNITNATVNVTDGNGAVNVSYSGTAGDGYEITVIDFYGKKNSSKLDWNYTVGGSTTAAVVKYRNALLKFDALDTKTYQISLSAKLNKSMIADNDLALEWVNDSEKTGTTPYIGTYVADNSDGGKTKTYTYLVYVPTISTSYTVSVMPSGDDKTLELAINYTSGSDALKDSDAKYALFLVTVRANADVTVNFHLNGLSNATEVAFEKDPVLKISGKLNVELLKYFDVLTEQVEDLVANAATLDDLKAIIDDLGVLFTVKKNSDYSNTALQEEMEKALTSDQVKNFVKTLDLAEFYWNLLSATSNSEVHHQQAEYDSETGEVKGYSDATTNPATNESYYYYQSPYMFYQAWLKSNGLSK